MVQRSGSPPGIYTLPETNIFAPESGWLEDEFPLGRVKPCIVNNWIDWIPINWLAGFLPSTVTRFARFLSPFRITVETGGWHHHFQPLLKSDVQFTPQRRDM